MVSLYSAYTVLISWQEVQKGTVLVASSAVWKPPQNRMPPMAPATSRASSEKRVLGRLSTAQARLSL